MRNGVDFQIFHLSFSFTFICCFGRQRRRKQRRHSYTRYKYIGKPEMVVSCLSTHLCRLPFFDLMLFARDLLLSRIHALYHTHTHTHSSIFVLRIPPATKAINQVSCYIYCLTVLYGVCFFSLFVFSSPFAMLSFSFRSICFVAFTQFFFSSFPVVVPLELLVLLLLLL